MPIEEIVKITELTVSEIKELPKMMNMVAHQNFCFKINPHY